MPTAIFSERRKTGAGAHDSLGVRLFRIPYQRVFGPEMERCRLVGQHAASRTKHCDAKSGGRKDHLLWAHNVDRLGDARGVESLETDDSVCFRNGLDFRESRSTRSLTSLLSLGVADVSEGRRAFRDRKTGDTLAPPQLPLMVGRRRNPGCGAAKADAARGYPHHVRHLRGCHHQRDGTGPLKSSSPGHPESIVICSDLR